MSNRKFFGELDTKDEKKIEEMDRVLFGDEVVDEWKKEIEEKRRLKDDKIKNMAV